jgi:hypothetical protein
MMAWRLLSVTAGELLVVLQDHEDASADDVAPLLAECKLAGERSGAARVHALVITDGGVLPPLPVSPAVVTGPRDPDAWLKLLPLVPADLAEAHGALTELQKTVRTRTWPLVEPALLTAARRAD